MTRLAMLLEDRAYGSKIATYVLIGSCHLIKTDKYHVLPTIMRLTVLFITLIDLREAEFRSRS